jgi:hypothetical protein
MEVILNGQCCKEAPEEDQKAQIPQAEEDEPTQEQVAAPPGLSVSQEKREGSSESNCLLALSGAAFQSVWRPHSSRSLAGTIGEREAE